MSLPHNTFFNVSGINQGTFVYYKIYIKDPNMRINYGGFGTADDARQEQQRLVDSLKERKSRCENRTFHSFEDEAFQRFLRGPIEVAPLGPFFVDAHASKMVHLLNVCLLEIPALCEQAGVCESKTVQNTDQRFINSYQLVKYISHTGIFLDRNFFSNPYLYEIIRKFGEFRNQLESLRRECVVHDPKSRDEINAIYNKISYNEMWCRQLILCKLGMSILPVAG